MEDISIMKKHTKNMYVNVYKYNNRRFEVVISVKNPKYGYQMEIHVFDSLKATTEFYKSI